LVAGRVELEGVTEGRELASACTRKLKIVWRLAYSQLIAHANWLQRVGVQEEVRPRCVTVEAVQMPAVLHSKPTVVVSNYG
jgi:hypothetical protein